MQVSQALQILGVERVIWIDDRFGEITPPQFAKQLTDYLEVALACELSELKKALDLYEIDPTRATQEVAQILTDLSPERFRKIKTIFFEKGKTLGYFPANELSSDVIAMACELLRVNEEDRWSFEEADQNLPELFAAGDAHLSYIVDLKEDGVSSMRGLEILRQLSVANSKGTYFVLTHETDMAGEGETETKLFNELSDLDGLRIPICVIAKERLYDKVDDLDGMEKALRISIKRAGLRRSLHEVLNGAQEIMHGAIDDAARKLLSIPPEKLESHVYERGYKEGVSELHVVERAITAHLGKKSREFFGVNGQVHASTRRLRALRTISIGMQEIEPDPHLTAFREAEVWESGEFVNRALTPIACGDVFEADREEEVTKECRHMFILLGQPCDISLRSKKPFRQQDTAFLIPLKERERKPTRGADPKMPLLPFKLCGNHWACDFRKATAVRLPILDLASFRSDGRVRVDDGHKLPDELRSGQKNIYEARTAAASKAMDEDRLPASDEEIAVELLLTFSVSDRFKNIYRPILEKATKRKNHGKIIKKPKRITWRLRRRGRVRMPYAAALLDQYASVMSRQAFDLDF